MNVVMKAFTINTEGAITAFSSKADAAQTSPEAPSLIFSTEEELTQHAAACPGSRLVQIWNALPGVSPVKKFTNRQTGAARIWKAIQALEPRPAAQTAAEGNARAGTKTAAVIEMLRRPEGATVPEIMVAMGWQPHSVRGFLSNLRRAGQPVESRKREGGARAYFLPAPPQTGQEQAS